MRMPRCCRAVVGLVALLTLLAAPASSQRVADLPAGARVRLDLSGWGGQISGSVVRATTDSVALRLDRSGSTTTYPVSTLRRARLSTGDKPGHVARHTTRGLVIGSVVGATLGTFFANDSGRGEQAKAALTFASIFAVPGVLLGAVYGNTTREGWRDITIR